MKFLTSIILVGSLFFPTIVNSGEKAPVLIGFDGEFGLVNSTSAQAIERGILIAIDEINRAGGVLAGRQLKLVSRDNRSVTARGIRNLKDFAEMPELVAMFVGRFSPVALEYVDLAHELEMNLLDPWAAADAITNNGHNPNYAFRVSLKDSDAMPAMFNNTISKGAKKVGLLLPNTSWGRSNLAAAKRYYLHTTEPATVAIEWYEWGDQTMLEKYESLRAAGAEAIIFVANDSEAVVLCREVAGLEKSQRLPISSHWGVTGGDFGNLIGEDLAKVDFEVVQTFSFFRAEPSQVKRVMKIAERLFGFTRIEQMVSPVGTGHAYDLTHILARAIDMAGSTKRSAIRDALEQVKNHRGLVKFYPQPFTADNHDALGKEDIFMAKYRITDGALVPVSVKRSSN
ncbi:MAG: branched-chain amino acid transport system substrate-binding protein [Planctomycetota bacterium]|jgi:branched-chain amino acid transport system substrate-binding protein